MTEATAGDDAVNGFARGPSANCPFGAVLIQEDAHEPERTAANMPGDAAGIAADCGEQPYQRVLACKLGAEPADARLLYRRCDQGASARLRGAWHHRAGGEGGPV